MAKRHTKESNDLTKVHVKLKPFLGMQPGLYLTILYALILLLIIFLVLFLPGIHYWGSQLVVRTSPEGAAVYVDGKYLGATPTNVFVAAGNHELVVHKPFYTEIKTKIDVHGRLVGSLFAPRQQPYTYQLEVNDLSGLLANAFHELSRWALVTHFLPNYQPPPILKDTVAGALQSTHFTDRKALWGFLRSSMADVHNTYLLRDFNAAVEALAGPAAAQSPQSLLSTITSELKLGDHYPDLTFWLAYALPKNERSQFEASPAFTKAEAAYLSRLHAFKANRGPGGGQVLLVDGMHFISVPSGSYIMGARSGTVPSSLDLSSADLPHVVRVPAYYMMSTEVTHAQFARFVAQNPGWAPTAIDALVKKGLVTSEYLKGWDTYLGPDYPQDYLSYYAAQAFCDWLQKQLPSSLSGYRVTLPTAAEYEWAARMNVPADRSVFHQASDSMQPAGTGAPNRLGIRDLLGNVWEWTSTWYFPASYFLTSQDGGSSLAANTVGDGAEKAVRGGSFASSRDNVTYTTRGSQPPDWCTPYLGFRPIIVKE